MIKIISQVEDARQLIKEGKIIAYPTEAIYGLGCDPFNQRAVEKLLALKERSITKGFIILISDWPQLFPLIGPIPDEAIAKVRDTWPGPVTWIFPKATIIPDWLSGDHPSIAIRMTSHTIAKELCADGPLVSTSANISGFTPAVDMSGVCAQFPSGVDALISGALGGLSKPSAIYDALSGNRLR
jgi:L-threonylcarbamoyladenylate synthase